MVATVRIGILTPYEVVRAGLRAVLSEHDARELVGWHPDLTDLDVVLYDSSVLRGGHLVDVVRRLVSGPARIVLVAHSSGAQAVLDAAGVVVAGSVRLDSPVAVIRAEIARVAGLPGLRPFPGPASAEAGPDPEPEPDEQAIDERGADEPEPDEQTGDERARPAGLSPRERDVMRLVAAGYSNDEIAQDMLLALNTVKTYIRTAYRKAGVHRRSQAVSWALRHGLGGADAPTADPAPGPALPRPARRPHRFRDAG